MAGLIKEYYPTGKIIFLGRTYTQDIVSLSEHVSEFLNYDAFEKLQFHEQVALLKKLNADVIIHVFPHKNIAKLAKSAKIKSRIGTKSRLYHWFTCNTLIRLKRRKSNLHEAQLNFKLLTPLNISFSKNTEAISDLYGFTKLPQLGNDLNLLLDKNKTNIILHPKSKGSAREWGIDNFITLVKQLDTAKYKLFVSGTSNDANQLKELLDLPQVVNLCGKLNLQQFIFFINSADVMVAASTGPLHIAAALNKKVIGLFAPMRPIFPTRWAPIGNNTTVLVENKNCNLCIKSNNCSCIKNIKVSEVIKAISKT